MRYLRFLFETLLPSIGFNLHYLPFRQAIHLPIYIRKPHYHHKKGQIIIDSPRITRGMIRLGELKTLIYPDTGIRWSNLGRVIFHGTAIIGANSSIIISKNATVEFGDDFLNTSSLHLAAFIGIKFGIKARLGWDTTIIDTNFHPLFDIEKNRFKKAYGKIEIGDYNWFGTQCLIMHSVITPERCIFGARSVIARGCTFESYCVHGGSPLHVLTRNVMRRYGEDQITDYVE